MLGAAAHGNVALYTTRKRLHLESVIDATFAANDGESVLMSAVSDDDTTKQCETLLTSKSTVLL